MLTVMLDGGIGRLDSGLNLNPKTQTHQCVQLGLGLRLGLRLGLGLGLGSGLVKIGIDEEI